MGNQAVQAGHAAVPVPDYPAAQKFRRQGGLLRYGLVRGPRTDDADEARRSRNGMTEIEWVERLVAYWRRHEKPQHGGVWHPTHKTPAEKRLALTKKAREKRAALKEK